MKKTLMTAATVLALVASAGTAMAGPLSGLGQHGNTHNVRPEVSQAFNQADRTANFHQSAKMTDRSFDVSTTQDLGQTNLTSTQQYPANYSKWSTELPNVVTITVTDNGSYTWLFGKASGSNLSDQTFCVPGKCF